MSKILSKTNYILYRECPKNVWYKIHKPDLYFSFELSDFEKHIIETGNEVELVARKLFPTGILIEGRDEKAKKETQEYISNKVSTLFQPVFEKDGFFAVLDVLKFNSETNTYSVYEIKASNEINKKTHYYDLAFQVSLLKKLGMKVEGMYLLHLSSEYKRDGELEITKLFKIDDVTEEIEAILDDVKNEMQQALEYISQEKEPGGYCHCVLKGRSKHCTTFNYSNPNIPSYGVHDISRIGNSKTKLCELVDSNIFDLKDIPEDMELTEIQRNQIDAYNFDSIKIDKTAIKEELNKLVFPLYFLDYETFPSAIPRFDKFSPYQQIPFQYSLHVLNKPDGELKHFEFLHIGTSDPSESFIESLEKHIGEKGSIIVWNKGFECSINRKIAERILEKEEFIKNINDRVYDLMDIFKKQYYVHKGFRGSNSIKKILPILAPELSYKNLVIGEGGLAAQSWNKIATNLVDQKEKEEIAENLLRYCELDTYAMYAIWRELYEI